MGVQWEERMRRTALLLDESQMRRLREAHVMLLGLGGVGSYAAEALCRAGIGKLTLVDNDTVSPSNLNRQLPALGSTVGRLKTEVVGERLRDIAPDLELTLVSAFYLPETPVPIPPDCTMVVDAVDTVSAKLHLARTCWERGVPLVSCMGMGNRLDPTQIVIGDLYETSGCPLCRVMRRELRKSGVQRSGACIPPRRRAPRASYPMAKPREDAPRRDRSALCLPWRGCIWPTRPCGRSRISKKKRE